MTDGTNNEAKPKKVKAEKPKKERKPPRKPKLWEAIISFAFLIVVIAVGIAVYGADPHIPMLIGGAFAAIMALILGYRWSDIETSMFKGIYMALQAVIILAIIGVLIGTWILGGVVPTMIYYGLSIMNPSIFLVATLLICSITSLATGTSWGTAGTIGIALMGVATGLGVPLPMAAGAIISGAYFGDKISPFSDTTNLAPAMAGTDVFTHVKFMIKPTSVAYVITLAIYLVIGLRFEGGTSIDEIDALKDGIADIFIINPLLLIPPVVVIVAIALKVPAIPGIFIGIILGGVCCFIQGGNLGDVFGAGMSGYESETGIEAIDSLLTAGGLESMMYSISMTILAMIFGGIMDKTGQLDVIVSKIIGRVKSVTGLVTVTMATCFVSNVTMPEQYISIIVPGRMYAHTYKERGLHPKMLSNALETGGTLTSSLVPWNTCGVFLLGTLGVNTFEYIPYACFNYISIVVVIIMVATKLLRCTIEDDPGTVITSDDDRLEANSESAEVIKEAIELMDGDLHIKE